MSPMVSENETTLNLFTRWTNARNDLYMYVTNVTERTIDMKLTDYEGETIATFTIGDILYIDDGPWVLTAVFPDDEAIQPWSRTRTPNAVFTRYF